MDVNSEIRKVVAENIIKGMTPKIKVCEDCEQNPEEVSWDNQSGVLISLKDARNILIFLQKFV